MGRDIQILVSVLYDRAKFLQHRPVFMFPPHCSCMLIITDVKGTSPAMPFRHSIVTFI
jgi:hypothetical protein